MNWQVTCLYLSKWDKKQNQNNQTLTIVNHMLKKIDNDITILKDGLIPENIAFWYHKIIHETDRKSVV